MGNVCQKRDTRATDGKSPVNKIFGSLQLCPHALNRSDNIRVEKQTNIYQVPSWSTTDQVPTAVPRRASLAKINARSAPLNAEWTDVPLKTEHAQSPNEMIQKNTLSLQQTSNDTSVAPVPPPRKRRRGVKQILDRMNSNDNLQPVEEAIIVPKKELIHICDPTRHPHHYHKTKDVSRKAHSTIIPPVYNDLEVKKELTKNMRRGSIPRNASLPGENNLSLSQATAQRLESYMTRCRSFGSLLPQQIMDKIKNTPSSSAANEMSDAESEDSWGGLDDWDLGVIEHDGMDDGPPFQPSSRLPSKKRLSADVKFSIGNDKNLNTHLPLSISKDTKFLEDIDESLNSSTAKSKNDILNGRKSGVNLQSILNPSSIVTISEHVENKEEHPYLKQAPLARRESIEDIVDWFDKDSDNENLKHSLEEQNLKQTDYDKFSSNILYDGVTNPFRIYYEDSTFNSDAFFTSKFLENEKMANNMSDKSIQISKDINETSNENVMDFVIINDDRSTEKKTNSKNDISENNLQSDDSGNIKDSITEDVLPTIVEDVMDSNKKPGDLKSTKDIDENIGHSNLLKFFKKDSNAIEDPDRPDRNNAKVDISGFH